MLELGLAMFGALDCVEYLYYATGYLGEREEEVD